MRRRAGIVYLRESQPESLIVERRLTWPERVRHLVIAGSGPGGPDGPPPHPRVAEIEEKTAPTREDVQFLFFTGTEAGTAAARRHFDRIRLGERPPVAAESGRRQREAIVSWWQGDGTARPHLGELRMPVLVANGIADVMVPAEHSFAIAKKAPGAKLVLYPDAGHAFLFQYAEDFCAEVLRFTAGPGAHAPGIRARPQNRRRGR